MNIFQAVIMGVVEGLSEFLPISSTGHLILTAELLQLKNSNFLSSFEIIIQLGAILSVVMLYFKRFVANPRIIQSTFIAFLPVVAIGLLFYDLIKRFFFTSPEIVLVALFLGGIALIIFEKFHTEKTEAVDELEKITSKQAILVGIFQCLAVVPGVSRAAATILGGLAIGLKRKVIVEFSFILAVPTMLAATILDLVKSSFQFSSMEWVLLAIGFFTSFIIAYVAIKFLLKFIQNHTFISFGLYRIALALVFWLIILK